MTNKERLQQNNLELEECIALAGTGGGGGGSGIIDVTELPTENIDENAVYRIINVPQPTVYVLWVDENNWARKNTFDEFISELSLGEVTCSSKYYEVDSLPEKPEMSVFDEDSATMTQTVYILNSTGASYVSEDGVECFPLYDSTGDSMLYNDHGWIAKGKLLEIEVKQDSFRDVLGLYSIHGVSHTLYTYNNGEWTEYAEWQFLKE